MKKYFYSNGVDSVGPLTFEELIQANIKSNTLIWHHGLDNWTEAITIKELYEFLVLTPPPLPNNPPPLPNNPQEKVISESIQNDNQSTTAIEKRKPRMFSNPFSFKGRIRRAEYVISGLIFYFISLFLSALPLSDSDMTLIIFSVVLIPMFWFLWAQGAKRSHDLSNSGWYQLIPFYFLWLVFAKGESGTNKYGLNPKD